MEGEKLLVSPGQLQRWRVMGLVEVGKITCKEGTDKFGGISEIVRTYLPSITI